jgi:TolB-like protein
MRLVVTSFHPTAPIDSTIAATVDARMATNLSQSKTLIVLERSRLEEAMKALKIESSSIIDPQMAVKLGAFMGATHVLLGEVSHLGTTVSLNARTVGVSNGVVLSDASKTVDGLDAKPFDLIDLLSTYVLKGLTSETRFFTVDVLEHEFTIKPARVRKLTSLRRPCETIKQQSSPSITIGCIEEYFPMTSPMEVLRGSDRVRHVDILVNNEVVASFAAQATDTTVEKVVNLDLGPATVTTSARVDVASADIQSAQVNVIKEIKAKIKISMRR